MIEIAHTHTHACTVGIAGALWFATIHTHSHDYRYIDKYTPNRSDRHSYNHTSNRIVALLLSFYCFYLSTASIHPSVLSFSFAFSLLPSLQGYIKSASHSMPLKPLQHFIGTSQLITKTESSENASSCPNNDFCEKVRFSFEFQRKLFVFEWKSLSSGFFSFTEISIWCVCFSPHWARNEANNRIRNRLNKY